MNRTMPVRPLGSSALIAVVALGVAVVAILLAVVSLRRIDPGNVGLLVDYSKGTATGKPDITPLPTGSYRLINPVFQNVQEYPIAQQTLSMVRSSAEGQVSGDDSVACQDKNGIPINVDSSTLWRVDPAHAAELYLLKPGVPLIGSADSDISSVVVRREVRNAVTNACSSYSYDEIYGAKRIEFGAAVTALLGPELAASYILMDKFLLGEIYLSTDQQDAINRKAIAQQSAIEASFLAEKAKNEAAAAVAKAEGDKQVAILQAQAQAQAIQIIQEQLNASPSYIEYLYAKTWNGQLPTTLLLPNGQTFPLIAIPGIGAPVATGSEPAPAPSPSPTP
jgi:regulator of protease activity HflC (stomatin/prohibitin superfamily)